MKNWQRKQKVEREMRRKDRESDRRTALSNIWKEWEENGEEQQKIEGVGDW